MKQRVIALGFFDGVHLGHAALLRAAKQRAAECKATAAALLFDRHPAEVLGGAPVPLLNTTEERALLMQRLYHIDEVIPFHFSAETAAMPWDQFVRTVLVEQLHARAVVAGFDFRFGHHAAGTVEKLSRLCAALGLGCDIIPCVTLDGVPISSSVIRDMISAGDVRRAAHFLGHFPFFYLPVEHGAALGRKLGTPTINQHLNRARCLPRFGVYVTRVRAGGAPYRGVTNIGTRPTVSNEQVVRAETYILDFSGDLYGQSVELELLHLIRPEQRFPNLDALHAAIAQDIAFAARYPL